MMANTAIYPTGVTAANKPDTRIAALSDMPREDLAVEWIKLYKHPPPRSVKRGLLERAIAYRYQTRQYGKLKADTVKTLLTIARSNHADNPDRNHAQVHDGDGIKTAVRGNDLKPGTRLVREWHGQTHHVNVTDKGFIWNNKEYASLSAIARAITGARWSGPRFFGL
jgi:hypothetical protein